MAPKATGSGNQAEIHGDGPLISGRPALSLMEVQQWFRDAYRVVPGNDAVFPIAAALNHCLLFKSHWSAEPEFKKARRANPSKLRVQRIGAAVRALQADLPAYLDDAQKINPNLKNQDLGALLEAVKRVAQGFPKLAQPRRGREPLLWHRIACNLKPLIRSALKSSGVQKAGFGKPTSPTMKIMQSALCYLGVEESVDTIFDALRGRKKKGKLIR